MLRHRIRSAQEGWSGTLRRLALLPRRGSPSLGPPGCEDACWYPSSIVKVSSRAERRVAREDAAAYHKARLTELVVRVGEAIDKFRAGELDAFDVDHVLFRYSRAVKELWKFCNLGSVEIVAHIIHDDPPTDWWERGAPRLR